MKKSILAVAVAAILISCGPKPAAVSLFNGKDLNGWTAVLEDSTLHPSTEFTVEDGAISLSGKFGYIRTEIPYADYRLNAEWRWPDSATNSGIFLHIQRDGIWPNCYECQLWNGKAGDLIHSSGTESAELRADSTLIILPKLEPSTEKPVGEWNTAEIVCSDSTDHRARQRPASEPAHRSVKPSGIHRPAKRRRPRPVPQHHPHSARLRGSRTLPPGVGITLGK